MKEYGSDFHYIEACGHNNTVFEIFPNAVYLANGRQAIQWLILHQKWKRIWMPEYFCYEIIGSIKEIGIKVLFYEDLPTENDDTVIINKLNFKQGDVLFRMNYFGLRQYRSNKEIAIPVIEDHSHSLTGNWTLQSDADWCIASLRKSLPIAEGGMIWSPKGFTLPGLPSQNENNLILAKKRWRAMHLKTKYLNDKISDKSEFRSLFITTENNFSNLPISPITDTDKDYLSKFNVAEWNLKKKNNWQFLSEICYSDIEVLKCETTECQPFSFVFLCKTDTLRDKIRENLIQNNVYPAILWSIPSSASIEVQNIGNRILSIACDGRYSKQDIVQLNQIINKILNKYK